MGVISTTPSSIGLGSVRLRSVPMSVPQAIRWPGGRIRTTIPADQPQLPWSGAEDLPEGLTGRQGASGAVRTVRFGDSWAGPVAENLPDPGAWSVTLAVAMSEVLRGIRPVAQLNRWLDPPTLTRLTVQAGTNGRSRTPGTPPALRTVHLQRSAPDIVEAVAIFGQASAPTSALAFRLEAVTDRWLCTALETRPQRVSPRA